jgi:uncharacterized OB-fold protein
VTYLKPLPQIEPRNEPFFDGLRQHEFRAPKCLDCGAWNWAPYPACRECLSEKQEWTKVSGAATVYSYTVVHRGPGAFGAEVPYVIVLAKLAEEPRSMLVHANLVDCEPTEVAIGMPIKVVYEAIPDEDITMWHFAPAGTA